MRSPRLKQFPEMRVGTAAFYAAALVALFVAYSAILTITIGSSAAGVVGSAAANVLSLAILGLAARALILRFVLKRPARIQWLAHVVLALLFTLSWFWLLMVMLGVVTNQNPVEFSVRPFFAGAAAWQLFQGLTLYGLVAFAAYAEFVAERTRQLESAASVKGSNASPFRLFVKQDDELRPLDAARIIIVRGADDYSEVVTATTTHLVRMSLNALGERLGESFIRAHRSCLVNTSRITRAEPAGAGRMLLHLDNGEVVTTSRSGARLFRERVI